VNAERYRYIQTITPFDGKHVSVNAVDVIQSVM